MILLVAMIAHLAMATENPQPLPNESPPPMIVGTPAAQLAGEPSAAAPEKPPADIAALVIRADACAKVWSAEAQGGHHKKIVGGDSLERKAGILRKNHCATLAANVINTCLKYESDPKQEKTCLHLLLQTKNDGSGIANPGAVIPGSGGANPPPGVGGPQNNGGAPNQGQSGNGYMGGSPIPAPNAPGGGSPSNENSENPSLIGGSMLGMPEIQAPPYQPPESNSQNGNAPNPNLPGNPGMMNGAPPGVGQSVPNR